MELLSALLSGAIRSATPLGLAALGELTVQRAGVINVGLEGIILAGALGGLLAADAGGAAFGVVGAAGGGLLVALLFAFFVVVMRADQIITGTAITLLALGATGVVYRTAYGSSGVALGVPTLAPIRIPGLASIPVIGEPLFAQPIVTYFAYALAGTLAWWMYRTHAGLALRALGESPEAATAAGIRPRRVQLSAIAFEGMLGGIAGGSLVLAHAGTFAEGMSAGRGFIAIAVVALGRWRPLGTALAALLFGAAVSLQYVSQASGWRVPYQLFLALPYLLTLTALAIAGRRRAAGAAPASLGRTTP